MLGVFAGRYEDAYSEGVAMSEELTQVEVTGQADIAIVSAGGYPKDIDLYQVQKCVGHSGPFVKPGGTMIVVAECSHGLGDRAV